MPERLAGSLPRRQECFVLAWAELHQEELLSNWRALQEGRPPVKIEPLSLAERRGLRSRDTPQLA